MAVWRTVAAAVAAAQACGAGSIGCPGRVDLAGHGQVSVVPTGWLVPGKDVPVRARAGRKVVPELGGRAYFATECSPGAYNRSQYLALDLLGKTLRYTADVSGLGCGCNAAFYLTSMRQNPNRSECMDYYCDANNVCGESCAEIDVQEANMHAWHSTLHSRADHSGLGMGYGGGGDGWSGPRNWAAAEYGPGARCIDTSRPFQVAASFPVDANGSLMAMTVKLSQPGSGCPLSLTLDNYPGMGELSSALRAGMTPIVSYWRSAEMLWLDGRGADSKGPCGRDAPRDCADRASFYDFSLQCIKGREGAGCRLAQPRPRSNRTHATRTEKRLRTKQAGADGRAWWDIEEALAGASRALAADGHGKAARVGSELLAALAAAAGFIAVFTKIHGGRGLGSCLPARGQHSSEQLLTSGGAPPA